MRFPLLVLGFAFVLGLSVGVTSEQAMAPAAEAGRIQEGLQDLRNLVDVPTGEGDFRTVVTDTINFVLTFLALIAVVTIIVAGFVLIFGMGSENSATRARKIIIYTIVGLIVIFFVRVIVGFFTGEIASIFS